MKRRAAGFTLLEVLVAFALLALALGLLIGALSRASRQVASSRDESFASLHAQSLLDELDVGEQWNAALAVGEREGDWGAGRYHWRLHVQPCVDAAAQNPHASMSAGAPVLLQVDLRVQWGKATREQMQWHTLRLVKPAAGP